VKEQAFSSQQAFVCSSSLQLKAKCSICMAGKTKATTTALRHTSHQGHGLEGLVSISISFKNLKKNLCLLPVKSTITFADSSGQEHTICRMVISFETATSTNEQKKWEVDTRQSQNHAPGTRRVKKQNWL